MTTPSPQSLQKSENELRRRNLWEAVEIGATLGASEVIDKIGMAGFGWVVPAGIASVTYYGSHDGATWKIIHDDGATTAPLVQAVTEDTIATAPSAVFTIPYIKIVSAAGAGTAIVMMGG